MRFTVINQITDFLFPSVAGVLTLVKKEYAVGVYWTSGPLNLPTDMKETCLSAPFGYAPPYSGRGPFCSMTVITASEKLYLISNTTTARDWDIT